MSKAPKSQPLVRRHLAFGWWSLLLFLLLGIVLEAMHGFKVAWYVDAGAETRRLTWRLAHAHGTFLALVHICFAFTLRTSQGQGRAMEWASRCLMLASVALPGGFLLGGVVVYGGDPGPGIFLLPLGAVALLVAVAIIAKATLRKDP